MDDRRRRKEDLINELIQLRREKAELESGWAAETSRRQECERQLLAQEGLAETAERLQALTDFNPCLVFLKDEAGKYVYLNQTYEDKFVGSKDWYGKTDFDFWSEESARLFQANDQAVLESGKVHQYMEDSKDQGGTRYCWFNYKFPFTDSKNRTYLAGIGIDATSRILAEEALLLSEEKYREIVRYAPTGIYEIDFRSQSFVSVNDAMCEVTGYSREELLTMNPLELLDDPSKILFQTRMKQYLSGQEPANEVNYLIKTKDGGEIWAELKTSFTLDANGMPRGATVIAHDITERKQAEDKRAKAEAELKKTLDHLEEKVAERTRQLAHERQRLLDVLETLPVNICLLTPDYEVRFANRAFRERFGESNGRHCYDYIFGYDKPCAGCRSFTPLETGQSLHWIFSAPDGSILDAYDYPFVDVDGSLLILEMNMDITEQKRLETEMARLDRLNLIGEMAASIGHEIRNPMTAVRGFLQMLGSKPEYRSDSTYFELMIEELDRANSIITEYLGMAKDKIVDLQANSLDGIITALHPILMSDANLREMIVRMELSNPPRIRVDEREIRQLIMNMARNGMEAMSGGGMLTIGTRLEDKGVVLYIKDEGHGLDPVLIEKLGTPFLTTKENGTGLGLAVCYSIAARHHARIDCETGPGGTTFYVRFPLPEQERGYAAG